MKYISCKLSNIYDRAMTVDYTDQSRVMDIIIDMLSELKELAAIVEGMRENPNA